jgi:hypothetical protein
MGTNCAPLHDNLFLYSYEADFIHGLLKKNEKKLARSSVASLLAATVYQGNPDGTHKL